MAGIVPAGIFDGGRRARAFLFLFALCGGLAVAQTAPSTAPAGSNDAVLSIRGLCGEAMVPSPASEGCTVVVSRKWFDDFVSIVAPERQATAGMKQSLARTYAELLALDRAARDSGIEDSPEYRERMQWLQVKTLAELFRRRLERESRAVPDGEIDAYYREKVSQFEEVKLGRVVLPRNNFASADRQKFEQDAERTAAGLRNRAAHGEELDALQKEAYEALGFMGQPPSTGVGNLRRANLPAEVREEIFSLRPGEVSKVEREAYSFVIYKVEAKWTLPVAQVREEIRSEISRRRLERTLKSITGNIRTELNEKYFGTVPAQ